MAGQPPSAVMPFSLWHFGKSEHHRKTQLQNPRRQAARQFGKAAALLVRLVEHSFKSALASGKYRGFLCPERKA
ncbi:hypothetical protein M7I_7482 [Glarea lozoyensis 74030]|uniref:Uncharacterized protein n=1 Tax=Glarea lozoyensis (strain ATCC 74030 / MF5533) TaxID=1104152 RepID=H0EXE8_GLAL7|nr:hypothetical protein M7I_7482 [Glarea lozoyensis 74030]